MQKQSKHNMTMRILIIIQKTEIVLYARGTNHTDGSF